MSMWEPFTEPARRAVVRAQQVAQMFGSSHIGVEHLAFALAENDDPLGAVLAAGFDRDAMRELLGAAGSAPTPEMMFSSGAKRVIEAAFENARRLNHNYISTAHLALGILTSDDRPPFAPGADPVELRAAIEQIARKGEGEPAHWKRIDAQRDPHPAAEGITQLLLAYPNLSLPGTRVAVTIQRPGEADVTWTYLRDDPPADG
jgi:ATP-dependent Clp protease ATP-binding subunit ClpA